jgi:hypothetical protein
MPDKNGKNATSFVAYVVDCSVERPKVGRLRLAVAADDGHIVNGGIAHPWRNPPTN